MKAKNDSLIEFFRGSVTLMLGAAWAVASAIAAAPVQAQDNKFDPYNKPSGKSYSAPAGPYEQPVQSGKPTNTKPSTPQTYPSGKTQGSQTTMPAPGRNSKQGSPGASQTKPGSWQDSPGGKGQSSFPGSTRQPSASGNGKPGISGATNKRSDRGGAWPSSGKGGSDSKMPSGRGANTFTDSKYPPKQNGPADGGWSQDRKYPDRQRDTSNRDSREADDLDEWGKPRRRDTNTSTQDREMQEPVELDEWGKPRQRGTRARETYQDERDDDAQPPTREPENRRSRSRRGGEFTDVLDEDDAQDEAPPREADADRRQPEGNERRSGGGRGYAFQCPGAESARRGGSSGGSTGVGGMRIPSSVLQNNTQQLRRQIGGRLAVTRLQCVENPSPKLVITFDADVSLETAVDCLWDGRIKPWRLGNRFTRSNESRRGSSDYVFSVEGRPLGALDTESLVPRGENRNNAAIYHGTTNTRILPTGERPQPYATSQEELQELARLAMPSFGIAIHRCTNAPDRPR